MTECCRKVFDDPALQRIYEIGQARIDALKAELPADGTIPIPFRCYGCDARRYDFFMRTGDGLPLCRKCFDGTVAAMTGGLQNGG